MPRRGLGESLRRRWDHESYSPPLSEDQESSTQASLRERSKKRTRGGARKKERRTEGPKIEGSFVGAWPAP